MEIKPDLLEELERPVVLHDSSSGMNVPEEFFSEEPFEDCLEFNGYSSISEYRTMLENLFAGYKEWQLDNLSQHESIRQKLEKLTIQITDFSIIQQKFIFIHAADNQTDLNFSYRDDLKYNFDQVPGETITPDFKLYQWLSPFVLLQKGITERALHFHRTQKVEVMSNLYKMEFRLDQIIDLDPNMKIPSSPKRATINRIDIRQTALLFHLLRKHGAVGDLSDDYLALLTHHLTGHSKQNLRTTEGFGRIYDIISNEKVHEDFKETPNHNLNTIKDLLIEITTTIDHLIQKNT